MEAESFFANIYDYFVERSLVNDLYTTGLCFPTALTALIIPLIGAIIFYYAINTIRFGELKHWLIAMLACSALVFLAMYLTCTGMESKQILINPDVPQSNINLRFNQGSTVFLTFAVSMFLISCISFLGYSMFLKKGSRVYKTPF